MISSVLSKLKPTEKEKKEFLSKVDSIISRIKIPEAKVILGGSGAKETWLRGNHDADLFVLFDFGRYGKKDISQILEKELRKNFRVSKLHGSRDYFQIKKKDFTFEIIPIYKISKASEAVNITDISPLHAKWVNKFDYKDDTRLAKAFCKSCGCYGAESYVKGFSGYALEILVIFYRGFDNFVKNISRWGDKVVIDIIGKLKNPAEELNKSKTYSPLILVDPVDKTRNVTAALGAEKFERLKQYCRDYMKNRKEDYFFAKKTEIPKNSAVLKVSVLKGKKDIVGAKLMKAFEFISGQLKKEGYCIAESGWDFERFWFLVQEKKLSKFKIRYGPPSNIKSALENFRKVHKKIYFDGDRAYAKIPRKHKDIIGFLKFIIRQREVKKRVKSISVTLK